MKKILFTLALVVSANAFGRSNNFYNLTIDHKHHHNYKREMKKADHMAQVAQIRSMDRQKFKFRNQINKLNRGSFRHSHKEQSSDIQEANQSYRDYLIHLKQAKRLMNSPYDANHAKVKEELSIAAKEATELQEALDSIYDK